MSNTHTGENIMPSLIDPSLTHSTINVAANYGKLTPQNTYGVAGQPFSNFATRQLRFLKVTATSDGATPVNFTDASYAAFSNVSVAIRALQVGAEIWQVFRPGTAGFLVAVSEDTINDSDTNSNTAGGIGGGAGTTAYTDLETAIAQALNSVLSVTTATATVVATDVDATGIALANIA